MAKRRTLTDEASYNGHPIQTDKAKSLKCDKKILQKINDTFDHAFNDHGMDRVFFMRYDIRFPEELYVEPKEGNALVRKFQSKFIKHLDRKGLNPHYVLVREQSKEKHAHYHGILLLDERKTQSIKKHIEKGDELLKNTLGDHGKKGLIDDCTKDRNGKPQKNGIKIKKNSPDFNSQYDKTFEWASYLAKKNTKNNNNGIRELFSSRLQHSLEKKRGKKK